MPDTIASELPEPYKRPRATVANDGGGSLPSLTSASSPPQRNEGSQLIRGALTRVIGYAAMVVLSVLATALITRDLGVSRFGQYATVISITLLVVTVTDSGMTNVASREYALLEGGERDRKLSSLLGLRITLTVIGTGLSMAFAVAQHYDTALLLGMLAASAATVPLIILHTLSIPLTNELRLGTLTMLELARQALWSGGLIALSIAGAGAFPLLAALLVANVLIIPPTVRVSRRVARVSLRMRLTGWGDLMRTTFVFSIATAVGTIYLYGTQLVTSVSTDHHQTGLFSLAFRVFLVTTTMPTLVGSAAVPLLSRAGRDDRERLAYVLRRYIETSVAGGIGVALVLSAASGFIVPLVAGSKFHAAIPVATIQCFALIGTFVSSPCSYGLLSLHLYRRLLAANGAALVVMVVSTVVLAHAFGAEGAAIASICGETTVALLMLGGLLQARRDCRPGGPVVAKLVLACACSTPLVLADWLPPLPRAVAVALLYAAILLLTRALPEELVRALPSLRRAH